MVDETYAGELLPTLARALDDRRLHRRCGGHDDAILHGDAVEGIWPVGRSDRARLDCTRSTQKVCDGRRSEHFARVRVHALRRRARSPPPCRLL